MKAGEIRHRLINCFLRIGPLNLTWDQALFSFRFENYIPAGMAKRKENPNFSAGR